MVNHVYHAAIGDMHFEAELDIPAPGDAATFNAVVQGHINAQSAKMFRRVSPAPCEQCKVRPAKVLLHHPLCFDGVDPPRVEDIVSVLCGRAECSQAANQEVQMALGESAAFTSYQMPALGDDAQCCAKCGMPGSEEAPLKQCARCKVMKYCSAACQKEHWPTHKSVCRLPGDKK